MDASNLLIIIPARGGSKGLPRKNARILGNHPLLKWTMDAITCSGLEKYQCVLSTDDEEIAKTGKDIGLDVPFIRPSALAGDTASAIDVTEHAANWFKDNRAFNPGCLMLLQPTSPFRSPHVIREAFAALSSNNIEAVVGVKPIYRSPETLFHTDDNNMLSPIGERNNLTTRRQDVRPLYTPNGAMYAIKYDAFTRYRTFFPKNSKAVIMDQIQSHDIDDSVDWDIATSYANSNLCWQFNDKEKVTCHD